MATKDWKKTGESNFLTSWQQKRWTGFIYLYKRGWFRGYEDKWVVSTSLTGGSNPKDRENIPFESKEKALQYIKRFMQKHGSEKLSED